MDAIAVLGVVGGVALLVAFYGGVDVDKIRIPPLPRIIRLSSGVLGAFLLGFVMWVTYQQSVIPRTTNIPMEASSETINTNFTPHVTEELESTETGTLPKCGALELTYITPGALLEGNIRLYKLIGNGFCSDTLVNISGGAFVGSDPAIPANSQPVEIGSDGTWLTVYIMPTPSSNQGETIKVRNPNGSVASMFVTFQR